MRAILLREYGEPELLGTGELPDPRPASGQVLVRTTAAAVNPVDLEVRSGAHAANVRHPFPLVLGWDLSGTVVEVAPDVTRFVPGDRVVAMSAQMATGVGTYAELVALDASIAAPAPHSAPLLDAAGLPLAGLTAHQALDVLAAEPGARVLVAGAAGSVGAAAVQLALHRGLRVVGLARRSDADFVLELGAEEVLVAGEELPRGAVDGLLDAAGVPGAVRAVRDGGVAVSIVPTRPPVAERGVEVRMSFVEQDGEQLEQLCALVDKGVLALRTGEVLGFADAARAHRTLAGGGSRGKLLLDPARD
ncbi:MULTISPECIES: NADP-dependent oxidoreductase [Actinosynnema]|uniref:NADP-dependent oxidoreductase n=1 Tax=Actinosynnema TaxID=40566 RepID=UPI0020A39752|nr:NADP-dependent oxidoreductase [Actinosynnema pretiosum]MCP2094795.1 NADPH:quinone reductase [Actinosynnema pretiosum]